ncbi:hypothetical protein SPF06_14835 [Sinomonas sp. JGH33]|uniref:AB hydrolase-1 domain-containing protein n=1 Tax=Sinomonas terricola TaxID=3110330 RepID=A0ABU5T8L1_9MICC|nr:hypothetical protein [Sinomonas sp. JGH33]MEA5456009.1 hypothetical protein [Sinomonas sp. JGH33]
METNSVGTPTGSFDPTAQSYCTSPDGKSPPDNPQPILQSLADEWLNWDCPVGIYAPCTWQDAATASYPNDLIDSLAHAGGYVLPFSYTGATMNGSPAHPKFTYTAYGIDDVANSDPRSAGPAKLEAEVASINAIFPAVPIVVIGHSNGGLIAEQWWARYRPPSAVADVFSLDSPLNGVSRAGPLCQLGLCGSLGVGSATANAYVSLWEDSASDVGDAAILNLDSADHRFTASGTYGDPLYDVGDAVPGSPPHNGILSQLILDPHCLASEDTTSSSCAPTPGVDSVCSNGPSYANPADIEYNNLTYGMPGSLWIHSEAKNCPSTVGMIMSAIAAPSSPRPAPSTPTAPPLAPPSPSATPGYATPEDAVDGFFEAELAGDWASVCSYVEPAAQTLCLAGTSGQGAATGHVTVGTAVVSGSQALVPVTGSLCAPSTPCVANSDPARGMPPTAAAFESYYAQAVANSTNSTTILSATACTRIGGKWYVAFG